MMKHLSISVGRSPRDRRRASVLMEFLLVFPIILLLVSMLLQFAQIWIARQITAYAAYCATRATLCVRADNDTYPKSSDPRSSYTYAPLDPEVKEAKHAAESVCAWMCLVGLSTDAKATLSSDSGSVDWGRFHDMTSEVESRDTIYRDVSSSRSSELNIPGWGSIPGSSSRRIRVQADVLQGGASGNYAAVRVRFKFPLLLPLAGKIISWAVAHPSEGSSSYNSATGTWAGDSYYSVHSGWHRGKESVMRDDGTVEDRSYATYGQEGKFPFIELTEICVLPRPYVTTNFKYGGAP